MNTITSENPELLSIEQAASFLNLKISKVRGLVLRNEIPVLRFDRLLRFSKSDLNSWVNQKKNYSTH